MSARFLQIHTLTHFPASLLNRDDAGFAKRMPFGGAIRTRISSQCLKRHWRTYDGADSLRTIDAPESIRSRVSFDRFVVAPLIEQGVDATVARLATERLVAKVFGSEAKEAKKVAKRLPKGKSGPAGFAAPEAGESGSGQDAVSTAQVTVVGRPELDYLKDLVLSAVRSTDGSPEKVVSAIDERFKDDKDLRKNIQALKPGSLEAGLGAALFGRMVTGDILARTDAAIHVAHAVTVHGQMAETDYFTAIDELVREEGDQASGHINASELTSGLYYGYVVVDVNGLVNNLGGDRRLARQVADRLVHIISKVSPGAKRGSTAPYAYSHLVLVESGNAQPRTLQNAFIEPVRSSGDLVQNTYRALRRHLAELDGMYGKAEIRAHAGLHTVDDSGGNRLELFENRMSLPELSRWTAGQIEA